MKLYRSPTGHWHGTKEDAEAFAKKFTTTWEVCEVPYDKKGLLAFLNEHKVGQTQYAETFPIEKLPPVEAAPVYQNPATVKVHQRLDVEEFIMLAPLDTALALGELVMSRMRDFVKGK